MKREQEGCLQIEGILWNTLTVGNATLRLFYEIPKFSQITLLTGIVNFAELNSVVLGSLGEFWRFQAEHIKGLQKACLLIPILVKCFETSGESN